MPFSVPGQDRKDTLAYVEPGAPSRANLPHEKPILPISMGSSAPPGVSGGRFSSKPQSLLHLPLFLKNLRS